MSEQRRNSPRALDEAAAWFARLSQTSVTAASLREFRDWRRDPANGAAYAEVEGRWTQAGGLRGDPDIARATEAALTRRSWRAALSGLFGDRRVPFAMATAALACVAVLVVANLPPSYATAVGEQRLVRLEDGSRLRLNTDSRVRLGFTRETRRLTLVKGEAFFEVAHDATRPFVVEAGPARIQAIGTRFDVHRADGTTKVTLVEGIVRVSEPAAKTSWTLAPNQQLTVGAGDRVAPASADTAQVTSWTSGRLTFRTTPLADAVAEVNRYSRSKIRLEADAVARVPVSGVFDTGDTPAFVSAVSEIFDLRAATAPDGAVVLRPASSGAG